jgi:hypothetical protein
VNWNACTVWNIQYSLFLYQSAMRLDDAILHRPTPPPPLQELCLENNPGRQQLNLPSLAAVLRHSQHSLKSFTIYYQTLHGMPAELIEALRSLSIPEKFSWKQNAFLDYSVFGNMVDAFALRCCNDAGVSKWEIKYDHILAALPDVAPLTECTIVADTSHSILQTFLESYLLTLIALNFKFSNYENVSLVPVLSVFLQREGCLLGALDLHFTWFTTISSWIIAFSKGNVWSLEECSITPCL